MELARLERALADAFDAADVPVATLDGLRAIPPEDWAGLVFTPHSSVTRLDFTTNALAIWTAIRDATDVPSPREFDPPQRLVIWREDTTSKVREISAEEAMLWDEASKGATFGVLCELAAVFDAPDSAALRAAQALRGWLDGGLLAR